MQWSLLELKKREGESLSFSETFELKESLKRRAEEILDVSFVSVQGSLSVHSQEYILYYALEAVITLPSTRSLTPVPVPLKFSVSEIFQTKEQFEASEADGNEEEILLIEEGMIDLLASVEDNLLLNLPIQVLSEEEREKEEYPVGEEWEVMSETQYEQAKQAASEEVDSRFAALKDFFEE